VYGKKEGEKSRLKMTNRMQGARMMTANRNEIIAREATEVNRNIKCGAVAFRQTDCKKNRKKLKARVNMVSESAKFGGTKNITRL